MSPHPTARQELIEVVYDQLRALAGRMRIERGASIQPTALVHEAMVRLLKADSLTWESETHFRAIAARAMRQILMDRARKRRAARHGGGWTRVSLPDLAHDSEPLDVLLLDEVLTELEAFDPRRAQVAVLKVFGELDEAEIAEVLDVSVSTVRRDWRTTRSWLSARLR